MRHRAGVEPVDTDAAQAVLALGCAWLHRDTGGGELEPVAERSDCVLLGDVLVEVLVDELGERHGGGGDRFAAHPLPLDLCEPERASERLLNPALRWRAPDSSRHLRPNPWAVL